jgi:hypothetical protein
MTLAWAGRLSTLVAWKSTRSNGAWSKGKVAIDELTGEITLEERSGGADEWGVERGAGRCPVAINLISLRSRSRAALFITGGGNYRWLLLLVVIWEQ